jgi:phage repressor protein C with HTH and peptisase S24 domain
LAKRRAYRASDRCLSFSFPQWLRGDAEPSRDRLVKLAQATGVTISWLAAGDGAAPDPRDLGEWTATQRNTQLPSSQASHSFVFFPAVATAAAAGSGDPWPGPATKFIGFRTDWIRNALNVDVKDIEMEVAIGDSMAPSIGNGDLLLVDISDPKIGDFGIYVLEARGERVVKRVQRKFDGTLILISDNPLYQPEEISPDLARDVKTVGKVIWRGGAPPS